MNRRTPPGGLPFLAALALSGGATWALAAPATAQETARGTLTLVSAVERALALHPDLAAARAGADAAAHAVDAARARRLPAVASSAEAVRFGEPMIVAPLHGFDPGAVPDFDRTLIQGRVGAEWTAWDGGATAARIRAARAMEGATDAGAARARQSAIVDAVDAYLSVLTARDVLAAHAARREALEAEGERVARFLEEGTAARVELLRAEAALSAARAEEEAARAAATAAESRLARRIGVPAEAVEAAALADVAVDAGSATHVPAAVAIEAGDHPALIAARRRADAADAGLDEAAAARLPTVRATGALQEFGGWRSDFSTEWQAGVRLTFPVFTGGARGAGIDRARTEARRAAEEVRAVERELADAADGARAALEEADARAAALARAVEQYDEVARIEALALEEGVGVQSDYLLAVAGLLDARTGLATARRSRVRAAVALASALGELTVDWLDTYTREERP